MQDRLRQDQKAPGTVSMTQRRLHTRKRPAGSAFVLFGTNRKNRLGIRKPVPVGPVNEISRNGLSIEYQPEPPHDRRFHHLSILIPGQGIMVYQIPFQTVSDIVLTPEGRRPAICRRGVRFTDVSEQHARQLDEFLRAYTRGAQPDRRSGEDRRHLLAPDADPGAEQADPQHVERRNGADRRG